MKKYFVKCGVVLLIWGLSGPVLAASNPYNTRFVDLVIEQGAGGFELAQSYDDEFIDPSADSSTSTIRPREAAQIARSAYPGSRVLKVKLLPSGLYAVTLRGQGRLTRVMVDAESGEIQ